jgi:hypothetical protein
MSSIQSKWVKKMRQLRKPDRRHKRMTPAEQKMAEEERQRFNKAIDKANPRPKRRK